MGQRTSIAGVVLLSLFALPFMGLGLFFTVAFGVAGQSSHDPKAYAAAAFGSLFALLGFGMVAAAVYGYRTGKRVESLQAEYPESPWMWREDWSVGHAAGSRGVAGIALWVLAVIVDVIVFAVASSIPKQFLNDPRIFILVLFVVIAIALTVQAAKVTLRHRRYGDTWFEFAPGSLVPGSKLQGTIHLKLSVDTPHGIDLKLSCVRRIVTGSGKSQTINEEVLWSDQHKVDGTSVQRMMNDEGLLPVEFMIPGDAYESNDADSRDQVIWKLHASADVVGVDFDDEYVIPVFRNASVSQMQSMSAVASASGSTFAGVLPKEVVAPASTQVQLQQDERGTVIRFGALRNPKTAVFLTFFALIWGAAVYLLFTRAAGGPVWILRVVFALSMVLIVYLLLDSIFGSSEVTVGNNSVTVRKSLLGITKTKQFAFSDVAKVAVSDSAQTSQAVTANCGLQFALVSGAKCNVAANTLSREEAVWVASVIEQAMGRSDRIGVEFTPTTAAARRGAPPQMRTGSAGARQARLQPIAVMVALVIFIAFFGLKMSRFMRISSGAVTRSTGSRAIAAGPMTDSDVTRLDQVPPQEFVEELLERSIRHDDRARELLMSRISQLSSRVKMTDSMAKLERQSSYSTDLRVRQANVAVNLAIAQFQVKDGAALDLLESARSNSQERASSVYYAGMLGSMETDKARIVEAMKGFALNDPDEKVRLWAVEGLRFFDSEEALAVEWQSFTTDASMSVRDRAGCNVSDCGIFQRHMRFKYVPNLIRLLDDPSQNSQMHTWAAMALKEITDANVASNRAAWEKWYAENGERKAAEFAALPWYQVRGDQ